MSHFKPLILLNTRTQKKEPFVPQNPKDVKVYCCGPTVYDEPHLGHVRTFIFLDILCRFLEHGMNYRVRSVMNITDCDNKILAKGGLPIARKYEAIFFNTMKRLNILEPHFTPRATEFWNIGKEFLENLREKGFVLNDNRFNIQSYLNQFSPAFVSHQKREPPKEGFMVWKSNQCAGLEDLSESGKPGWHMECASMNAYFFGDSVDLHVGGIDLIFPHHENEIALGRVLFQNENWVRYTLHTGHLEIDGCKMSKSEKNFITLQDMLDKNYSPLAIRYLFLKHAYEKPMHFNEEELKKAQVSYDQLMGHLDQLEKFLEEGEEEPQKPQWEEFIQFQKKLDDYLLDNVNIPEALQVLENYVTCTLPTVKNKSWLRYCFRFVMEVCDHWFGLISHDKEARSLSLVPQMQKFRSQVREEALKTLKLCDKFRKELDTKGFLTEDENM